LEIFNHPGRERKCVLAIMGVNDTERNIKRSGEDEQVSNNRFIISRAQDWKTCMLLAIMT
jgi:hypothetical protein